MKAALVFVFGAACSAATLPQRGPNGTCTTSRFPIATDLTVGIAATVTTIATPAACAEFDTGCATVTISASTLALAALSSAMYGIAVAGSCEKREAKLVAGAPDRGNAGVRRNRYAAWTLTREASEAAVAGKCELARKHEEQVRDLDTGVYLKLFLADAAIDACLRPPAK
jgi:hypothetical protein